MDERRNDGGPAFPREALSKGDHGYPVQSDGMSLRDWFAGQALMGLAASQNEGRTANILDGFIGGKHLSEAAYTVADAMLKVRK